MASKWTTSKLAKIGFGVELEDIYEESEKQYGKTVVISQEEFEKSLNPSMQKSNKPKQPTNIEDISKESHFFKKFTAEERQQLNECFKKYSTAKTVKKPPRSRLNASGIREVVFTEAQTNVTISEAELGKLFQDAGIPIHAHTLSHVFQQLVKKKGAGVSFSDITELLDLENGAKDKEQDYEQIFQLYDKRQKGYFEFQDYKLVCQGVAKDLTEAQMHHAFRGMDLNKNGKITLDIFIKVMKGVH